MGFRIILTGIILLLLSESYAQEKADTVVESRSYRRVRQFSPEGKPKYYVDTDVRISEEEFQELLKRFHKVHMLPFYDKYGEMAAFYVDTTNTRVQRFSEEMKIPEGKLLPDFVMTGYNGEVFDSEQLKGRKVVFYFLTLFSPRDNPDNWVSEFKRLERQYRKTNTVFIVVTVSEREEFMEAIGSTPVDFNVVTDGTGFMRRFSITRFPSYLVIDESGRVVSYLGGHETNKLDQLL